MACPCKKKRKQNKDEGNDEKGVVVNGRHAQG